MNENYLRGQAGSVHGAPLGQHGMIGRTPLDTQVGGGHYKKMVIQPVEFIHKNNIPFIEGCVIKYVSRWRDKGGVEDLRKARHFLDLLIGFETENGGL